MVTKCLINIDETIFVISDGFLVIHEYNNKYVSYLLLILTSTYLKLNTILIQRKEY